MQVEISDFNDSMLKKNSEIADLGHLNNKGAKHFSLWFDAMLKKGLLSEVNKDEFIKSEIDKLDK